VVRQRGYGQVVVIIEAPVVVHLGRRNEARRWAGLQLWGDTAQNAPEISVWSPVATTVTYSCVQGGAAGAGAAPPQLDSSRLMDRLPGERPTAPLDAAHNPLAVEQNAAVTEAQSKLKALDRSYYPQFLIQGLASARGTGLLTNGERLGGLNGLAPNVQNFGLGLTVTFPAMDRFALREREAAAAANMRAGQAQSSVVAAQLEAQFNAALARFAGARRVAANTPVEVSSAQTALEQATARYRAGLAPIDDVAQSQRLLAQARIDDSLARLSVWRAQLAVEAARGDIQPFLAEAAQ